MSAIVSMAALRGSVSDVKVQGEGWEVVHVEPYDLSVLLDIAEAADRVAAGDAPFSELRHALRLIDFERAP